MTFLDFHPILEFHLFLKMYFEFWSIPGLWSIFGLFHCSFNPFQEFDPFLDFWISFGFWSILICLGLKIVTRHLLGHFPTLWCLERIFREVQKKRKKNCKNFLFFWVFPTDFSKYAELLKKFQVAVVFYNGMRIFTPQWFSGQCKKRE